MSEARHNSGTLWRNIIKYAIPLVISAGLCYLLFTDIDFNEMLQIVRDNCNFRWIALALAISIVSFVCRACRWRIQLQAIGIEAPLRAIILSIFGTYSVNLVFPRLGEVWRCGYIARRQDAPFTAVFGSMVADRLADTLTVLLLAAVTFLLSADTISGYMAANADSYRRIVAVATSPWLWGCVALLIVGLVLLMRLHTTAAWVQKIRKAMRELWQGFAAIAKMKGKGRWLLWTVGIWVCFSTQMVVCFYAFPFTEDVIHTFGLKAALVTYVISSIAMGVPSNGGIGPWQWAVIFALGIYGVQTTQSGAFANLVLGTQTLMLILLGIITFIAIALERKALQNTNNINTDKTWQKSSS